jgi:hypothetical protein
VGNRDARYAAGAIGIWEPGEPDEDAYAEWIRTAAAGFAPHCTGRSYINFQTADAAGAEIRDFVRPELLAGRRDQAGLRPREPVPHEPEHRRRSGGRKVVVY